MQVRRVSAVASASDAAPEGALSEDALAARLKVCPDTNLDLILDTNLYLRLDIKIQRDKSYLHLDSYRTTTYDGLA
jgi:hypothetical protein